MFASSQEVVLATFKKVLLSHRLSHAHIFISNAPGILHDCAQILPRWLLCTASVNAPCTCESCAYSDTTAHPDVVTLGCPIENARIKIQEIRDLLPTLHIRPKVGKRKVVIIHSASTLNPSVGNGLLKILEEPPAHVVLILFGTQVATVLPTILSRCQTWNILNAPPEINAASSPLRRVWSIKHPSITLPDFQQLLLQLHDIKKGNCSPYLLAEEWKKYELLPILNFVYTLNLMALQCKLAGILYPTSEYSQLETIASIKSSILFRQIDTITATIKRINLGYSINETVILEDLLAMYQG